MEAASANYRATQGMGAVVAGLKGIGKAVLALTGGWIGLGIAASMAVFEMSHAYSDKRNFMKNHAVVVNGEEVTTDEQEIITARSTFPADIRTISWQTTFTCLLSPTKKKTSMQESITTRKWTTKRRKGRKKRKS